MQYWNIPFIRITFSVLKFVTSNEVKPAQSWNMKLISVTKEVSNIERSREANLMQSQNMPCIVFTFFVLKFRYKFSNWSIYEKIPAIFVTLEVSKFVRFKVFTLTWENIKCISVTLEVSKEDTSNSVNVLQPQNISLIETTNTVFTFFKLIDVKEVQLLNIWSILLIKEVS